MAARLGARGSQSANPLQAGRMLVECYRVVQGLGGNVEVSPLVVVAYSNRARPEGATLSLCLLCSRDTELSQSPDNRAWLCIARRLLPLSLSIGFSILFSCPGRLVVQLLVLARFALKGGSPLSCLVERPSRVRLSPRAHLYN